MLCTICKVHRYRFLRYEFAEFLALLPLVAEPDPGGLPVQPQPVRDVGELAAGGAAVLLELRHQRRHGLLVEHGAPLPLVPLDPVLHQHRETLGLPPLGPGQPGLQGGQQLLDLS